MKKLLSSLILVFILLTFTTSAFAAGNQPSVSVTTPWSTSQSSPSTFSYQPNIEWYQSDPDSNTVFKDYWIIIYDANWNVVYNSGIVTQNTTSNTQSHQVPIALPKYESLPVVVHVTDNQGNSELTHPVHYLYIHD
jgi:hypothetical protein